MNPTTSARGALAALACLFTVPPLSGGEDPRTKVLVRESCVSSIGQREVTLFANGTIRLREGAPGEHAVRLGEVGNGEVDAFVRRLAEQDLSETDTRADSPEGAWVESCMLELDLPGLPFRSFRFGRYASHSLALKGVLGVVRDIEAAVGPAQHESHLPAGYRPEVGDRLERVDGVEFEIVGFTADGNGVELSSPVQPITLYLPKDDLRLQFVRILSRRATP